MLVCVRDDGSVERADLGPNTPYHDMAHFIVERYLGLKLGFYGQINRGYSVSELSDKEIIKTLPSEAMVSEIITRALQSVWSGAVSLEQVQSLVEDEMEHLSINFPYSLSEEDVFKMYTDYDALLERWRVLNEGESVDLEFIFG